MLTKTERCSLFRERLGGAMLTRQLNRTSLGELARVDRSTISALLNEHLVRLPSGHVVAEVAQALGVSTDWLLGLTNSERSTGEILKESLEVAQTSPGHADEHIERWLRESAGAKIRGAPTSLPEFMKTQAVLELEFSSYAGKTPQQASAHQEERLRLNRTVGMDYEIAMPMQTLQGLANRSGLWAALSVGQVQDQLVQMADLCEELYPSTRLHLFDSATHYSAPIVVFGQRRAVIYIGSAYFVFNTREHVEALTRHFDQLVRDACVLSHEVGHWLRDMARSVQL